MNIDFIKDDYRFIARSSAIIFNKDKSKILLFKVDDNRDFYLLPGGRIEYYEDSLTAIKREIKEELGFDIEFSLCSIQENFIVKDNKKITQYCFCYRGVYNGEIKQDKFVCKDNDKQYFYWVDVDKLSSYNLLPKSTFKLLDSNNLEHFVEKY